MIDRTYLAISLACLSAWTCACPTLCQAAEGPPFITTQPASQTVLQGDPATFTVVADGTAPLSYHWLRNGSPIGSANLATYTLPSTSGSDHGAGFSVVVSNSVNVITSSTAVLRIDPGVLATNTLTILPFDATWRFNQANNDLGATWKNLGYNDAPAPWTAGPGVFDYKTSGRTTIGGLAVGTQMTMGNPPASANYPTFYFRTHFNYSGSNVVSVSLRADVLVDDAVALYLNGQNWVTTPGVTFDEPFGFTGNTVGDAAVANYPASAAPLVNGDNLVAAQVHQVNATSSDITFGLAIVADVVTRTRDTSPPVVQQALPAANSTVNSVDYISVTFDEPVRGVEAADLRLNGQPATNLFVVSPREYQFTFPPPSPGLMTLTWAPAHGITDLSVGSNSFGGAGWSFTFDPNAQASPLIISEFLADNNYGLEDEEGTRADWIEIYNPGPLDANLEGWFLTDDPADLTKWRFPNVNLAANRYLLVWASEKDRTNPAAPLHTNFKLERNGEYLALVDNRTNVVSDFSPAFPQQWGDVSYGHDRVDPLLEGYFTTPTPRAQNSTSGSGFAEEPVFSAESGVYTNSTITLSLSAPAGTIRYTLNGSVPTTSSPQYIGPFTVGTNVTIKARVFQTGLWPSRVVAKHYFFLDSTTRDFNSNLPLLVMDTRGVGITANVSPGQARTLGALAVINKTSSTGRVSLLTPAEFVGQAEFEIFGQTSAGFPKKPYNIEVQDELGNDLDVALLGMPAEADWKLRNPYSDKCMMNDFLGYELFDKMGHYQVRRQFVEVFVDTSGGRLTYPGDYHGILVFLEKIEVGNDRVDIAELTPGHTNEPAISGGYMFKKDKDSAGDLNFSTSGGGGFGGQGLKVHEPKPRAITTAQLNWLRNYLNQFESKLYAANWLTATGTNHYSHYIDVDSFVDSHWIVEFTKQIDGYRLSNFFTKDRNGKLKMEPIWDWNLSFGNADYLEGWLPNGWYYTLIGAPEHIWLRRLITGTTSATSTSGDPDFNQKLIDRWSVLRTNVLNVTNVITRVDQIATYLNEAQARDFSKFPRLGSYIWPNPSIYSVPTTYSGIITNMKNWLLARYLWIDGLYTPTPALNHSGGFISPGFPLTISGPANATLYYTLDGRDPRSPGGAISPAARTYSGAVPVTANARVFARAWRNGAWSGPAAATLVTALPDLRITEIMYHPDVPAGSTNAAGDFEYLELVNVGSTWLSLAGFKFTNGVEFVFTATNSPTNLGPGERVLVVKNRAAFVARYPAVAGRVAGEFVGSLDNAGERLVLVGPVEEVVHDFAYDNAWYPLTDGCGFSLVVVNEGAALHSWTNRTQWRPSAGDGGSPGAADPAPPVIQPVLVNEALSHSLPPAVDAIELYNPNASAVDVGGWYLSDTMDLPRKYQLPPGTTIQPFDFLVLYEDSSFNAPGAPNAFALSSQGDDVYLFSADATGRLTGYYHGFDFGPAAADVTFGRHVTSVGETHFVAQSANTLDGTNVSPRVGPVVINEIMFHPPDLVVGGLPASNYRDEFIELRNATDAPVPLFDEMYPDNTWRLEKGVDFVFPTGLTLPAGDYLLVVGFDPVRQPSTLAAFRARYSLSSNVPIYGPFAGQLDNSGERVELRRPGDPNPATGVAPLLLVDRVDYMAATPWPVTASGTGGSLQRKMVLDYGNDPANWVGAGPSPGGERVAGQPPVITTSLQPQTVLEDVSVTFHVDVTGTGPFFFQWYFNDLPLEGAYQDTLVLPSVKMAQAGDYRVTAMSSSGSDAEGPVRLNVVALPLITQQPSNAKVGAGSNIVLRVTATNSTGTLDYQWTYNGTDLAGATTNTLIVTNAQLSHSGNYQVRVTDTIGSRTSQVAVVTVLQKPVISLQPLSQTALVGQRMELRVEAAGSLPLFYRWRKGGTTYEVSKQPALVFTNLVLTNGGSYDVVITNDATGEWGGFTKSTTTYVIAIDPPADVAVEPGTNVTLRVAFSGPTSSTNRFQWLLDGSPVATGSNATASFTNSLVLSNVTPAQAGTYTFVFTNSVGLTGAYPAVVRVLTADADGDGMPDDWETAHHLQPGNPADAGEDLDGDGLTNLQEYLAGTDPEDAASTLKLVVLEPGAQPAGGLAFEFNAMSNRTYSVESCEVIGTAGWSNLLRVEARPSNWVVGVSNTEPVAPARYFRVRTPAAP